MRVNSRWLQATVDSCDNSGARTPHPLGPCHRLHERHLWLAPKWPVMAPLSSRRHHLLLPRTVPQSDTHTDTHTRTLRYARNAARTIHAPHAHTHTHICTRALRHSPTAYTRCAHTVYHGRVYIVYRLHITAGDRPQTANVRYVYSGFVSLSQKHVKFTVLQWFREPKPKQRFGPRGSQPLELVKHLRIAAARARQVP